MNKKLVLILSIFGFLNSFVLHSAEASIGESLIPLNFNHGKTFHLEYEFLFNFKSGVISNAMENVEGGIYYLMMLGINLSFMSEEEMVALLRLPINFDTAAPLVDSEERYEGLKRHLASESIESLSSLFFNKQKTPWL